MKKCLACKHWVSVKGGGMFHRIKVRI